MAEFIPTPEQSEQYRKLAGTDDIQVREGGHFTLTKPISKAAAIYLSEIENVSISFEKVGIGSNYYATFNFPNLDRNDGMYAGIVKRAYEITDIENTKFKKSENILLREDGSFKSVMEEFGKHGITFHKDSSGRLISYNEFTPEQLRVFNSHLDDSWITSGRGNITSKDGRLIINHSEQLHYLDDAQTKLKDAFAELRKTSLGYNPQWDIPEYILKPLNEAKNADADYVSNVKTKKIDQLSNSDTILAQPAPEQVAKVEETATSVLTAEAKPINLTSEKSYVAAPEAVAPVAAGPQSKPAVNKTETENRAETAAPAEPQADTSKGTKPVADNAMPTPVSTNANPENIQTDQAGGTDKGPDGKGSSGNWFKDTLTGDNSSMILAIGGGLLAFLLAGGGNVGSFFIAGIVALVAGTMGPDLMRNLFDDTPKTPSPSNTPPEKLLRKEHLKSLTNYNTSIDNELDKSELGIIAALDGKKGLSNEDIQKAIGGDEETAKKVNAIIASQLGAKPEKDGTIDLSEIGELPVSVSIPALEAAHKDAPSTQR